MNLFILRHASAGTSRLNPLLDVKRPLDKEGKQHCLQLAYVLNALKVNFDMVVSSPLKRALQTAQLVSTEMGYEAPITLSKSLAPAATVADFHKLLGECKGRENVLMVGHNPNLQEFLSAVLTPKQAGAGLAKLRLRKGSIARVSLVREPATLQMLLDPRTVRALYATSTKSSRRKTSRK